MMERYRVRNMFAPVAERIAPPVKAMQPYGGPRVLQPQPVQQASAVSAPPAAPPPRVLQPQPQPQPQPAVSAPKISQYGGPAPEFTRQEPVVPTRTVDRGPTWQQTRQLAIDNLEAKDLKDYQDTFTGDNANSFQSLPGWAQRKYASLAPAGYTVPAATSALDDMIAERASMGKGDARWSMLGEKIAAEQARLAAAQQMQAGYNAARYGE